MAVGFRLRTALLAAVFAGWAGAASAVEITIAQSTDATSLDPAFRADTATGNVQRHLFDTLLVRKADMSIGPGLAETVEQDGPTRFTLRLRKGVTFSNGEPFDAEAVKFSIERAQNPELKAPTRSWWLPFKTVTVVDPHTVTIETAAPDPLFRARLTLLAPVPPKHVKEAGAAFAQKPVGTGPYRLVSWRRDDAAVLEPNPTYWGDKPTFTRVTFRVVPEELSRVAALQTGEADVVAGLSPLQAAALERTPGLRVERAPSTRLATIQFDVSQPPGDNPKFREAVSHAINRDEIVKGLMRGFAAPVTSMLAPGIPDWPQDKSYVRPHDPQKAAALVKELGLGNQEILMRTPSGRYPSDRETALAVAAQLGKAGLNVRVRPDEWGRFFDDLKARKVSPLYLMGQGNVWLDPYPQIEAFQKTGGFLSTWSDPQVDALLERSNTVPEGERKAIFGQILERLNETAAVVPLYAHLVLFGVRDNVKWTARPDEQVLATEMTKTGR